MREITPEKKQKCCKKTNKEYVMDEVLSDQCSVVVVRQTCRASL